MKKAMSNFKLATVCSILLLFIYESEGMRQFSLKRSIHPRKIVKKGSIVKPKRENTRIETQAVDLESCREITYTCSIELGTPAQVVDIILDTGSADLWVLKSGYDGKHSSTYKPSTDKFNIAYVDGDEVTGTLATDKLKWGDLVIPSQIFGEVEDNGGFSVSCDEVGILGLALDGLAHSQAPSAFHNLVLLDKVSDPIFSFHIVDDEGSTFTLGGYDSSQFEGELQWFQITELSERRLVADEEVADDTNLVDDVLDDIVDDMDGEYYYKEEDDKWQDDEYPVGHLQHWEIPLHHASMSSGSEKADFALNSAALIDTGTSRILVPRNDFVQVANAMKAECWFTRDEKLDEEEDGFFRQDCSSILDLDDQGEKTQPIFFSAFVPCSEASALTLSFGGGSSEESFSFSVVDLSLPAEVCKNGQFKDCFGSCQDSDYKEWIGDGSCDNGKQGFSFNCKAFDCDGGDCTGDSACEMKDPEETCQLGEQDPPPLI